MIEFLKFLKGYVCIRVSGFSPERFMNLCSNRNILLWDIRKDRDVYYMCLSISGFYKLRPIVKKTGTKVAIVKRCGLPFFMPKMWKRKVFILGFLLAAAFWVQTSRYIWAIEIEGNFMLTQDILMDFLEENQVCTGMKKESLNIEELEQNIRKEFYQITWTSAKLEGTKLTIQIKENELLEMEGEAEKENTMTASNLVAEQDGMIVSMIVREGIPQVTIGQEVKKGDVLVAGNVPVYQEDGTIRKYQYCNADADIILEHVLKVEEALPLHYEKKSYTGREKKQFYLEIFGKIIRFGRQKSPFLSYDSIDSNKQVQLLANYYLPIIYGSRVYREYYIVEEKYTEEEAKFLLNEKFEKIIENLEEKGVQIIGKDVKIETNDVKWVFNGEFVVQEKTGINVAIEEEFMEESTEKSVEESGVDGEEEQTAEDE